MTLQEAIKTTKRFKRPHHENWFDPSKIGASYLSWESALAGDWEVEPEKSATITRRDLHEASFWVSSDFGLSAVVRRELIEALAEKLGL